MIMLAKNFSPNGTMIKVFSHFQRLKVNGIITAKRSEQ
ncbi:hypothetical protein VISI1226_11981 [Vibrio sinaloensis DSM 21326]|uniref:Uncharacterized protein n=1 Tax=Vibrio sinaloensis DSM 21326 TaxID=945550 RepID=E8M3J5_PHOS4|nr:hypothetical protein VISI1226_11981 [Vibrio sinaloensis DSM 21326]